jgi:hypothetical protein
MSDPERPRIAAIALRILADNTPPDRIYISISISEFRRIYLKPRRRDPSSARGPALPRGAVNCSATTTLLGPALLALRKAARLAAAPYDHRQA